MIQNAARKELLAEAESLRTKGYEIGHQMQIAIRLEPDVFREVSMLAALRGLTLNELLVLFIDIQIEMEHELQEDEAARILWGED
jgi:hypothetical protein